MTSDDLKVLLRELCPQPFTPAAHAPETSDTARGRRGSDSRPVYVSLDCIIQETFQIVDDLLDEQGDAEQLGKQTGKDTEHGKLTYPDQMGVEGSRDLAADLIRQACQQLDIFGETAEPLRQLA